MTFPAGGLDLGTSVFFWSRGGVGSTGRRNESVTTSELLRQGNQAGHWAG